MQSWNVPGRTTIFTTSCAETTSCLRSRYTYRLRNGDRAELAVCDVRGRLLGGWREARAVLIDDPARTGRALAALHRKYGWQ